MLRALVSIGASCGVMERRSGLLWTRAVGVTLAPNGDARVMKTDDTILF